MDAKNILYEVAKYKKFKEKVAKNFKKELRTLLENNKKFGKLKNLEKLVMKCFQNQIKDVKLKVIQNRRKN